MRRGFKANAERMALAARAELGLAARAALDSWVYAKHIGVLVLTFEELKLPASARQQLLVNDPDSWSGMTMVDGELTTIILNPAHAKTRQASTLMHELAHVLLKHKPARVDISSTGLLLLSDYSDEDEEEADFLAAAMLLPRETLMWRRRRGDSVETIAAAHGLSESLCQWRLRMTGVDIQLRRFAGS